MIYVNTANDPINNVKIQIHSDAFVTGVPDFIQSNSNNYATLWSSVHKALYYTHHTPSLSDVHYATITAPYLTELATLHKEWFPVTYDKTYFKKFVYKPNYYSLGAFVTINNNEYLIGCALGEICSESKFRKNIKNVWPDQKWYHIFEPSEKCGYLNTIGVVDEYRKLKIGTKLMEKYVDEMKRRGCIALFLHTVEYNQTSINFYEKNHWLHGGVNSNYYWINETYFDAVMFYYLLNIHNFKNVKYDKTGNTDNNDDVGKRRGCCQALYSRIEEMFGGNRNNSWSEYNDL